jgi:hypothetical protein
VKEAWTLTAVRDLLLLLVRGLLLHAVALWLQAADNADILR